MKKHAEPPKVAKPVRKKNESTSNGRLTVLPIKETAGHDLETAKAGKDTGATAGAPTAMVTGTRERPEIADNDQPQEVLVPVVGEAPGLREDDEARVETPFRGGAHHGEEEVKEPVVAFESHHTDMSDARYSPEPPKVEDYADEEDGPTFDDMKIREARMAKEREAQEEAARKAEALRKAKEADLAAQKGKVAEMSEEAQNILSKYS
mmetsp:Transcript_6338/g.11016  ORF Transcript_6338/g.11016 Transcript_6338/m.11016 type:complete len:207 (-) Transcript_6338:22-642(-)